MKKALCVIVGLLILTNLFGQQLKKVKKKLNCPNTQLVECEGQCEFELRIEYPNAKNACNGQAYDKVSVYFLYKDPGNSCEADIERTLNVTDNITWKTCKLDGAIINCKLTKDYFPDNSLWPPFHPGNPAPADKLELSADCFASLAVNGGPGGWQGGRYEFKNVTHFDTDFTERISCECNGVVKEDSITLDTTLLIGCCFYEETIDCLMLDETTCNETGGVWTENGVCNPETSECDIDCKDKSKVIKGCCETPSGGCIGEASEFNCCEIGGTFNKDLICINTKCVEDSGSGNNNERRNMIEKSEVLQYKKISLNIIPNPTNGLFHLNIKTPESNTANIKIYNSLGELIYETSPYIIKGDYKKQIQLPNNTPSGTYFVNVKVGEHTTNEKVIVIR